MLSLVATSLRSALPGLPWLNNTRAGFLAKASFSFAPYPRPEWLTDSQVCSSVAVLKFRVHLLSLCRLTDGLIQLLTLDSQLSWGT